MPHGTETEERAADVLGADGGDMDTTVYSVRARATGLPPTDELLAAITERVPDPGVFEQHPPVFMRAAASNRNLDAYFTRMAPSTLQNFATDAAEGVSFLNSHNMRSLGFGQTFAGRYVAGGQQRTDVDFYVLRGLKLNETANDDFIAAVGGGSVKDVSVGFYPGEDGWYRCGVCDARMERFFGMAIPTCGHWPGDKVAVNPKDESKGTRTAFAWVEDHRLAELSAVNDGATPGAEITEVKVRHLIAAGHAPPETVLNLWEQRCRAALPRPARVFGGAGTPAPPKEERMDQFTPEQCADIRLVLATAGAAPDGDPVAAIRALADEVAGLRALPAEVERLRAAEAELPELRALADQGRQYRADLVTAALAEGARAYGQDFAEETYRGLLEAAPLETIKRMTADWKRAGDELFKGGRVTQDPPAEAPPAADRAPVPLRAYR